MVLIAKKQNLEVQITIQYLLSNGMILKWWDDKEKFVSLT